ncbi:hypothetical protein pb186bvf_014712 [Paramecium bursaria]
MNNLICREQFGDYIFSLITFQQFYFILIISQYLYETEDRLIWSYKFMMVNN